MAGLVWAAAFAGLGGGFLAGAVLQGYFDLEIEQLSDIVEVAVAIPTCLLGAMALAWQLGRKVRLSAAVRYGLVLLCLAAGFLIGRTLPSEEGTRDDAAWLRSDVGKLALALLAAALVTAAVVSLRRYLVATDPLPDPGFEEAIRHG